MVQSVARQPLELDILVRVQAPEPPFHRFCDSCFNRRGGESLEILCFARLQSPANLTAADRCRPTRVAKGTFAVKSIAKRLAAVQARETATRANSVGLFCSDESARGCDALPCAVAFNPSIDKPLAMDERLPSVRPLYAKNANNDC